MLLGCLYIGFLCSGFSIVFLSKKVWVGMVMALFLLGAAMIKLDNLFFAYLGVFEILFGVVLGFLLLKIEALNEVIKNDELSSANE